MRLFLGGHFLLQGLPKSRPYVIRESLRLNALVNLQRLLGSVHNDEAVGALIHVCLPMLLCLRIHRLVEVGVQFLEELFTGNQVSFLPSS